MLPLTLGKEREGWGCPGHYRSDKLTSILATKGADGMEERQAKRPRVHGSWLEWAQTLMSAVSALIGVGAVVANLLSFSPIKRIIPALTGVHINPTFLVLLAMVTGLLILSGIGWVLYRISRTKQAALMRRIGEREHGLLESIDLDLSNLLRGGAPNVR